MNGPSPSILAWVRLVLAAEAPGDTASNGETHLVVRVSEKLRISLTRFVGADGYTALLRRAVALAASDPSLRTVKVTADGRLETLGELAADGDKDFEAATAITAHLLALLVTFIGESLTLRLVRDAWPDPSGRISAESEDIP